MNHAANRSYIPPRVLGILAIVCAAFSVVRAQNPSDVPGTSPGSTARIVEAVPLKNAQTKQDKDTLVGGGQTANETKAPTADHNSKTALTRIKQGDELGLEIGDLKKRIESQPNIVATAKLFLDCKPVAGLQPRACVSQNKIVFVLDRAAIRQITPVSRSVSVGVGFNDAKEPEILMPENILLVLLACDWPLWVVLACVLVLAVLLYLCGQSTNLLRDPYPGPANGGRAPYSLAKTQMAWWLFFIASAFAFIYVVVGDFNSVPTSALVLLAISAGTAAGSKLVDSTKQKTAQNLQAATSVLNTQIAEAGGPARPAVQAEAIPGCAGQRAITGPPETSKRYEERRIFGRYSER